jgi:replicative DNA helicase
LKQTPKEIIEQIKEAKKDHEALPTGFEGLDKNLDGGFFKKELIVIGAHTGIGKSQIAGQIFHHITNQGYKSAYFSLEISNEMLISRLIGSISNIKPTIVRYGWLQQDQQDQKIEAEAELVSIGEFMNFYDSVYELKDLVKEITENKYEFVVIDFIQNVMDLSVTDEYSRLTKVSLTLQKMAKELNCCVLVLSQLSNQSAREGAKSKVLEYKGSGAIATVCDLGFFLDRDINGNDTDNVVSLRLRKNRRGVAGVESLLRYKQPGGRLDEQ